MNSELSLKRIAFVLECDALKYIIYARTSISIVWIEKNGLNGYRFYARSKRI